MRIDPQSYPIIIMSCDSYRDIWPPMIASFEIFWPDCPFPVYVCSESVDFHHPKYGNIKVGKRMEWSAMLIEVLSQLNTKNVIYLQEDYILKGPIKTAEIDDLLTFYESTNAAYLRLIPFPPPDQLVNEELNVGINHPESPYRTSLQAAVWDREIFLSLLRADENGWQFEQHSVGRSTTIERPFYSMGINSSLPNKNHHRYPLDYYSTAVLQGKWQKEGVKILRNAGITIDTSERGCLTRWDFYFYHQRKTATTTKMKCLNWLDRHIFNRSKRKFRKF